VFCIKWSVRWSLSKTIVSQKTDTFLTGGQLVAGIYLDLNNYEANNALKDSFLPCEASALFQQVMNSVGGQKDFGC
jgi:hypothetical protein